MFVHSATVDATFFDTFPLPFLHGSARTALADTRSIVLTQADGRRVAWWAMRDWLDGFDARIALGPGPFALAGLLALAIALATVSGHALRVARMNPIHALRYE